MRIQLNKTPHFIINQYNREKLIKIKIGFLFLNEIPVNIVFYC